MTAPSWAGAIRTVGGRDEVLVPCDSCGGPVYESSRSAWRAGSQPECGLGCEPRAGDIASQVHWGLQGIICGAEVVASTEYVAIAGPLDPDFDWPVPVASRDGVPLYLRPRDREVTVAAAPGVPMERGAESAEGDGRDATTDAAGSPTVQLSDTMSEDLRGHRTTLPCPAWCQRGSGHGFEDVAANVNEGLLLRAHEADLSRHVWVSADEYAVGSDGPVWETLEPLVFLAKSDCMTSGDARAIAAELLLAADLVDLAERGL